MCSNGVSVPRPTEGAASGRIGAPPLRDQALLDTRIQAGDPPDIAFFNVTSLNQYKDQLVPVDTLGASDANIPEFWRNLGTVDGQWLGMPVKADVKSIIWYSPVNFEAFGYEVPTTWEELDALGEWGLPIPDPRRRCLSIEEVIAFHQETEARRETLPFEIDGIVVKVDRRAWQDALGMKSRSPRWGIAFKFAPRKEITQIQDIVVSVGRTGTLTPLALLKPVEVGGVTISRATLHNADEVARKDVRVGDTVKIERAGDVIPEIIGVVLEKRPPHTKRWQMPKRCPVCGSEVRREEEQAAHRCMGGLVCQAQRVKAILHFAARSAMDVEGLGDKLVEQLVQKDMIATVANDGDTLVRAAINAQVDVTVDRGPTPSEIALKPGEVDVVVNLLDDPANPGEISSAEVSASPLATIRVPRRVTTRWRKRLPGLVS